MQLIDLITQRLERHYEKRLIAAAYNRPEGGLKASGIKLASGLQASDIESVSILNIFRSPCSSRGVGIEAGGNGGAKFGLKIL